MKVYLSIILALLLAGIVSANGLTVSPSNINITKSEGIDYSFTFNIQNTEPIEFRNITSNNPFLRFDTFSLASGELRTITARLTNNVDFNGDIRIIGDYNANIGASNVTRIININYDTGFSLCDANLIKGDTITWVNGVGDQIRLRNVDTGTDITTIPSGMNYTIQFNNPTSFNYQATIIGLPFTETCNINVMDTQGWVHNSQYDGIINVLSKINYNPTAISLVIYTSSYNIQFNGKKEDILSITNTGNAIARNVKLTGDWMTFNSNNFDLSPGEQKNIQYTITPVIYDTSQTNKTYSLNLKAEGNFPLSNKTINVSIPYASIGSGISNGTIDYEFLENTFRLYCQINPEFDLCKKIYNSVNNSQPVVSAIFTEQTIKDLLERQVAFQRDDQTFKNHQQEVDVSQTTAISSLADSQNNISFQIQQNNQRIEEVSATMLFNIIFILFIFFLLLGFYILTNERLKSKISRKLGLSRGESSW